MRVFDPDHFAEVEEGSEEHQGQQQLAQHQRQQQ